MMVIFINLIFLLFASFFSPAWAADIKAVWATSGYAADIKFIEVDDHNAPKWYIGSCSGDITLRADRVKIYEAEYKGSDVREIQLVTSKYYADEIYCIKE